MSRGDELARRLWSDEISELLSDFDANETNDFYGQLIGFLVAAMVFDFGKPFSLRKIDFLRRYTEGFDPGSDPPTWTLERKRDD